MSLMSDIDIDEPEKGKLGCVGCFTLFCRCWLCRGRTFEERALRVAFLLFLAILFFMYGLWSLLLWIFGWGGSGDHLVFVLCVLLTVIGQLCIPLNIAIFICTTSFEIGVFFFNTLVIISSMFAFYVTGGGILGNGYIGFTCLIPIVSITFCSWRIHQYFWIFIFIANSFVSFSLEFFVTNRKKLSEFVTGDEFYVTVLVTYASVVFPVLVPILMISVQRCKKKTVTKKVRFVSNVVESLKFDKKEVKKLMKKNENNCSEIQKHLLRILKNTQNLSRLVPNIRFMKRQTEGSQVLQFTHPFRRNNDLLLSQSGTNSSFTTDDTSVENNDESETSTEPDFYDDEHSSSDSSVAFSHDGPDEPDLMTGGSQGTLPSFREGNNGSAGTSSSSISSFNQHHSSTTTTPAGSPKKNKLKRSKRDKNRRYFTVMLISFDVDEGYTTINPVLMDIITSSLTDFRGTLNEVEHGGESILCSFNALKKCVNHEERSCRCALQITKEVMKFFTNLQKSLDYVRKHSERVASAKTRKTFEFELVEDDGGELGMSSGVREERIRYEYRIPEHVLKEVDVDQFEAFGGVDYVLSQYGENEYMIPQLSITIVSDFGTYGLIGGHSYQKFTFLGENMRCLRNLARYNLSKYNAILMNDMTQDGIKFYMKTKLVDLGYNKNGIQLSRRPFKIYKLLECKQNYGKKKKRKQWLYEVRESVIKPSKDERKISEIWEMIRAGEFDKANECIDQVEDEEIKKTLNGRINAKQIFGLEF